MVVKYNAVVMCWLMWVGWWKASGGFDVESLGSKVVVKLARSITRSQLASPFGLSRNWLQP